MAAGDILKEAGLVVESFTVKANEDIEKGELVVNDGNGIIHVNENVDVVAKTDERFVDGVVNDFVNEMMQTAFTRVADIHRGPFANSLNAF